MIIVLLLVFVLVFVLVRVIDPSFRPTIMAADTVDYEHEHRYAEHEGLGTLSAGSGSPLSRKLVELMLPG